MPTLVQRKVRSLKPKKPYPDFPLFAHATKRWAKKIRGRLHYFGTWDNPDAALNLFLEQQDDLYAGRKPREANDGLTVRDLCNRFLTSKRHMLDTREISQRTFEDYHRTCERIIRVFGKNRLADDLRPDDFDLLRTDIAKKSGPVSLGNEINRCRVVFKFAYDADLIDRPVKYGPTFKRPTRRALRIERHRKRLRMFEAAQIKSLLADAPVHLKAMILLAVNCGFGNADIGLLPLRAIDLDRGWVNYPRPKTGIARKCPLWPETVEALRQSIASRPAPRDAEDEGLVFITKYGRTWHSNLINRHNPIAKEFRKIVDDLELYRPGLSFYALRHTFETIGGECRDQVAVDHIMGHARDDMASVYRERISDERLVAVTTYVHYWLFGKSEATTESGAPSREEGR
jgi:integrase